MEDGEVYISISISFYVLVLRCSKILFIIQQGAVFVVSPSRARSHDFWCFCRISLKLGFQHIQGGHRNLSDPHGHSHHYLDWGGCFADKVPLRDLCQRIGWIGLQLTLIPVVWKNLHSLEGRDHRNWGRQEGICTPLTHLQALARGSSLDLDPLAVASRLQRRVTCFSLFVFNSFHVQISLESCRNCRCAGMLEWKKHE